MNRREITFGSRTCKKNFAWTTRTNKLRNLCSSFFNMGDNLMTKGIETGRVSPHLRIKGEHRFDYLRIWTSRCIVVKINDHRQVTIDHGLKSKVNLEKVSRRRCLTTAKILRRQIFACASAYWILRLRFQCLKTPLNNRLLRTFSKHYSSLAFRAFRR